MATALGNQSIQNVEEKTDRILDRVNEWEGLRSDIETQLNGEVGQTFSKNIVRGGKAAESIRRILDVLLGLEERIKTLATKTYNFCDEQREANEREIQ